MRTMLKIAGVPSYLVAIYSVHELMFGTLGRRLGSSTHDSRGEVSPQTVAPSVIEHPQFGRLMIFDPTDEMTPPGYLPGYEQDSLALVLAGDSGALLPGMARDASVGEPGRERGRSYARCSRVYFGQGPGAQFTASARNARRSFSRYSRPDYVKRIERWVASTATEAAVSKVEPEPAKMVLSSTGN